MLTTAVGKGQLRCQMSNKAAMLHHIMLPRRVGLLLHPHARFTTARAAALAEAAEAEPRLSAASAASAGQQQEGAPLGGRGPEPSPVPPARMDSERFAEHWSVELWRDLKPRAWFDELTDGSGKPLPDRLQHFLDTLRSAVSEANPLRSGEAASYWAYHVSRSGFFIVQVGPLCRARCERCLATLAQRELPPLLSCYKRRGRGSERRLQGQTARE